MNTFKLFVLVAAWIAYQQSTAQTVNWENLPKSAHVATVGTGWDYSMSYALGYAYRPASNLPVLFSTQFSAPFGEKVLDDMKWKAGGQALLVQHSKVRAAIAVNGIYRKYTNPLVRLNNIGAEVKATLGHYRPRFFIAAEAGLDFAMLTHLRHTSTFRENVFQQAQDGWYRPGTASHFLYGFQAGISFQRTDILFGLGQIVTLDFQTTPLIPYYLNLGINRKIQ